MKQFVRILAIETCIGKLREKMWFVFLTQPVRDLTSSEQGFQTR